MKISFFIISFLLLCNTYSIEVLKKHDSAKIENCQDIFEIALDVSEFSTGDKIYIKIKYDTKYKENIIAYKFSNNIGEFSYYYNNGVSFNYLVFAKPSTSNFYYTIEKEKDYKYLNLRTACLDGEIKNCKIHEGFLEMFFVLFLIVLGGVILLFLIIIFIKKLRQKALLRNNQINQPDIVIVNNNAQPNIETNQNENQNIQKNVNAPENNIDSQKNQNQNQMDARFTNLQNTEGEVIPFSDNLESKQNNIKA
jgi:hypothetical protein